MKDKSSNPEEYLYAYKKRDTVRLEESKIREYLSTDEYIKHIRDNMGETLIKWSEATVKFLQKKQDKLTEQKGKLNSQDKNT